MAEKDKLILMDQYLSGKVGLVEYLDALLQKQEFQLEDEHMVKDPQRSMKVLNITNEDIEKARQLHERLHGYKKVHAHNPNVIPIGEDSGDEADNAGGYTADNVSRDEADKVSEEEANKARASRYRLANSEVFSARYGMTSVCTSKNCSMDDDEETPYMSLPTPPLSPSATVMCDPWLSRTYLEDEEKSFIIHDLQAEQDSTDAVMCGDGKPLRCQCLGSRCDPMWSSVGQEIAGIPCEEKFATDPLVTHDPMFGPCVDPSIVSLPPLSIHGYPLSSDAKKTSLNIFPGYPPTAPTSPTTVPMETPSASESDENDEIDVVSVGDDSGQSPYLTGSSSASAHVAAIHNYSSHQAAPMKSLVRSAAASPPAPHIPTPPSRRKDKRATNRSHRTSPYTPASPANRRTQKNGGGVDMHKVAQKLGRIPAGSNHRTTHGAASGEENDVEDTEGKRAQHNVLERERRNCLKNQFFNLRDVVPEIANQERAAKVVILKKAILYCSDLRAQEKLLTGQCALERKRCTMLKQRLEMLLSERKQALAQVQR